MNMNRPAADSVGSPRRRDVGDPGFFAKLGISTRTAGNGGVVADKTARNVECALAYLYGTRLQLDNRSGAVMLDGLPLREGSDRNSLSARVARFLLWHEDPPIATLHAGLAGAAGLHSYDPVVRALDALAQWDGESRFEALARALGVRGTPEDVAHSADLLKKFCIGAVRRAREPGCQMDNVLVLVGGQGLRKTSALRALAQVAPDKGAAPLFARVTARLRDKDARMALQGPWIVELAELAAVKASENEDIKSFLDERDDWYRPPYAATTQRRPRRVVVCGSTNDEEFLNDATGARRYWPVDVQEDIDLAWISANRDSLWAEADALAVVGEPHWFRKVPTWLGERHETAHEEGVLDELVERAVERYESDWRRCGWFQMADILAVIDHDAQRRISRPDMVVGRKLTRMGFKKRARPLEGTRKKVWLRPAWKAEEGTPSPKASDAE